MPTRHRRLGVGVALALVPALVGPIACGDDDSPDEASAESTATTPAPTTTSTAPTTTTPDVTTEDVTFTTGDGLDLVGRVYGEGTTAIVCSHQRQSSKADFAAAGPVLAAEGFMVLAYDNRGDGESEQGLPADQGLDLLSAIELVRARGAEKVVLLGASRGGTLSLDAATQTDVDAIVTLSSPPPDDGPAAVAAVTAPSLYVTARTTGSPTAPRKCSKRPTSPRRSKSTRAATTGWRCSTRNQASSIALSRSSAHRPRHDVRGPSRCCAQREPESTSRLRTTSSTSGLASATRSGP